jgi:hypothetical protein
MQRIVRRDEARCGLSLLPVLETFYEEPQQESQQEGGNVAWAAASFAGREFQRT